MENVRGKVVFVSESEKLLSSAQAQLSQAHWLVETRSQLQHASFDVPSSETEIWAVDLETQGITNEVVVELLAGAKKSHNRRHILLLLRATQETRLRELFRLASTHFMAIAEDEHLDGKELLATIEKIRQPRNIFGLEKYLAEGAQTRVMRLQSSTEKNAVVDAVSHYALEVGFATRISQGLAVVADELITNGLYNAPVDGEGQPRFARLARTVPVHLLPHEHLELRMAFDGKKFGISASDPFGSLSPVTVVDYLAKCFRKEDDQIDSKEGGAGLGLYKLFTLLQHFVVNIEPHRRTETIGLVDVTRSYREFAVRGKSFNLFVLEP